MVGRSRGVPPIECRSFPSFKGNGGREGGKSLKGRRLFRKERESIDFPIGKRRGGPTLGREALSADLL